MEKNKKLILLGVSFLFFVLAFVLGRSLYQNQQAKEISLVTFENSEVFLRDHSPKLGNPDAKIHLVEFLDPECESCRVFAPLVKSLLQEFDGKIQLVVRYAPFHANSEFAIKILEAARFQGKYWEVLDVLFQFQPEWGSHHHPKPELIWQYLERTGVDIQKIKNEMNDEKINQFILQDKQDGEKLGVVGTPSFFVNGKPLEVFGYEPLRMMILKELENLEKN